MRKHIRRKTWMNRALVGVLSFLIWTTAQAASPLWTIVPASGSNPNQTVPENATATMLYIVQNQSNKFKRLVIKPIPGISQTTPCELAPKDHAGSSCTLNLVITGSELPQDGIHGGPVLCQANQDGSPNPNQCYQPSNLNSLNITRGPVTETTITVNPSTLSFVEGNNGQVTVTNNITSSTPANNVLATIPGGSNISVQSTTCGPSLAIGASCTITFTAPATEGPTYISISGSNTNTENVAITVTPVPMATISVNPTTLVFATSSTGNVTVTNNAGSPVAANNVVATIPGGSSISVQSTTCGASLSIGASCTITFSASATEGPTTIPIAGDNTNTVNVDVTVSNLAQISITNPVQQNRVVTVSSITPLSLEITNSVSSTMNANAITVSNMAACPNLSVDSSNCVSVAPGASCTLELTSSTPYAPCTITISGSNTTNSPTTLIAFFYLGGLVFQESAGSGKVVIDVAQGFSSMWTSSSVFIAGTNSVSDGVSNTNAIVADASCSADVANCAAQRCRDINAVWYLPALNELSAVRGALCSNLAIPCNFGGFSLAFYWSSTQFDFQLVFDVLFPSGTVSSAFKSGGVHPVRCIRSFP